MEIDSTGSQWNKWFRYIYLLTVIADRTNRYKKFQLIPRGNLQIKARTLNKISCLEFCAEFYVQNFMCESLTDNAEM